MKITGAMNFFADQGKEDRRIRDRVKWAIFVETDSEPIFLVDLSTESIGFGPT